MNNLETLCEAAVYVRTASLESLKKKQLKETISPIDYMNSWFALCAGQPSTRAFAAIFKSLHELRRGICFPTVRSWVTMLPGPAYL